MDKMLRWVLLFVVLSVLVSGVIAFYTVFFSPEGELTVPPLRERSVVEAVAEAERLGFVVQIEQVASTLPEGRVLGQSPEPGKRAGKRQVIVLQVSRGGELHAVPDVRGQSLAAAQNVLKEQGFALGDVIRIKDSTQNGGVVIAQSPASPANIALSRKVDLLVNEGGATGGMATIPDVNRMTEQEARSLLEASGLKVAAVEKVYSPMMPEGLAIETRPGAGSSVKAGESVRLKIATLRRPAGYIDPTPTPEGGSVRRADTPAPATPAPKTPAAPQPQGVVVTVPGQGDVFIGDGTPATGPIQEANPNVSVYDQERVAPRSAQSAAPTQPAQPAVRPATPAAPTTPAPAAPSQSAPSGGKVARIRYQVPPLTSPLPLRIELTDPSGKRNVLNRQARSGENVYLEAPYSGECVVSIYLGGEFVWQEKHK